MEKYINYLVEWLQEKVRDANANGAVVGVSGGIDSAVVASLLKKAFPNDSMGLIMPCHSSEDDVNDGLLVVNNINMNHKIINLDKTFDELIDNEISIKIDETKQFIMSKANTKARLRMTSLYAVAQNYNYLVCGTDNACEWHTGYFTKFGDGGADIAPLIHLTKGQVYKMAHLLGIDDVILNKVPSAGLISNQTDEDELQVMYDELDAYLENKPVSKKTEERIEYLHKISEHKRNIVVTPSKKVSDIK